MNKNEKISMKREFTKFIAIFFVYIILLPLSYLTPEWIYPVVCILAGGMLCFQLLKIQTIILIKKDKKMKFEFVFWSIFSAVIMTGALFFYEWYLLGTSLPFNINLWLTIFNVAALYGLISMYVRNKKIKE